MAYPKSICAAVAPKAIEKASRFFNAGLEDIFTELLQNARRAGATKVTITVMDDSISVQDNGEGIDDPEAIMRFGASNWSLDQPLREDAAGMGFFALANYGCKIRSYSARHANGWKAEIPSAAFGGNVDVIVTPLKEMRAPGTTIAFPYDKPNFATVQHYLCGCGKYCPLEITLIDGTANKTNPVILGNEDFLKECYPII